MSWKGGLTLLERGTRDRAAGEVGGQVAGNLGGDGGQAGR
jgi:hypothetical protein